MTAESLFRGALARLDPADAVERALQHTQWTESAWIVVALGKSSVAMARGARRVGGDRILQCCVVCPAGAADDWDGDGAVFESAHPRPDERSLRAGRALVDRARNASSGQRVLALISGGGSSLAAVPVDGLPLADKALACDRVHRAGAAIADLNCVRKHLSAIKGGRLAQHCRAPIATLISSDVPGDDPSAVASGPTIPDPTSFEDACRIVEATCGLDEMPGSAADVLIRGRAGQLPDTPHEPRDGDEIVLVSGIDALVTAVLAEAHSIGIASARLGVSLSGEIDRVATQVAAAITRGASGAPICLVAGGEPTISVPADAGVGGRASHLALLLARELAGVAGVEVLVAGSDGVDGNSDRAGAIVDGQTWQRIADGPGALRRFDSATALGAVGAGVVTGPTGINHADVLIAVCRPTGLRSGSTERSSSRTS